MSDWSEIVDEMHKRARQDEEEAQAMSRKVREQLLAENSTFLKDFTETDKRLLKCKV